jgi:hypothetical protein
MVGSISFSDLFKYQINPDQNVQCFQTRYLVHSIKGIRDALFEGLCLMKSHEEGQNVTITSHVAVVFCNRIAPGEVTVTTH